jgi:hypothetical protein
MDVGVLFKNVERQQKERIASINGLHPVVATSIFTYNDVTADDWFVV